MGFFDKIKQGLSKTRDALSSTLGGVFSGFSELDDDFFDELEESLILADLGVETAVKATQQLRKVIRENHLKTTEEAKEALKGILVDMLQVGQTELDTSTAPSVVLVIGVNGVGRTFKIAKYSAMATNAFSPPESKVMVFTCFPGGCTLISMPHVSGFSSSSNTSSPLPPSNISANTCPKY